MYRSQRTARFQLHGVLSQVTVTGGGTPGRPGRDPEMAGDERASSMLMELGERPAHNYLLCVGVGKALCYRHYLQMLQFGVSPGVTETIEIGRWTVTNCD